MPQYLGKGPNFYLVVCERLPTSQVTKQEQIRFHQTVCQKCKFYTDAVERYSQAVKKQKPWRRLQCVHPSNKAALDKWKAQVTVWGR